MSDLISRSALIEALIKCDGLGRKSCELIAEIIKNQPIAYNVDKVVGELEDIWEKYDKLYDEDPMNDFVLGLLMAYSISVDIVKEGGVNND